MPGTSMGARTDLNRGRTVASLANLPTGDHDDPDGSRFAEQVRSGAKLAARYRLDRQVRALPEEKTGGPQTWIGFDELLNRKVGLYLIDAGHPRAEALAAAAREAATVPDARFVQVLDAVEEPELVYVINEWISDAASLGSRLADGPLSARYATKIARELAEAMSQAHDCGMTHGALDPETVLVSSTGQIKILGLRLEAVLSDAEPAPRDACAVDVRAIGRLWYAALTAHWPGDAAYGLDAAPTPHGKTYAPAQVRAAIPKPVDQLVARLLSEEEPSDLVTTKALSAAISQLPRLRDDSEFADVQPPSIAVRPPAPPAVGARFQGVMSMGMPDKRVPRSLIAAVIGVVLVLGAVAVNEFVGKSHSAVAAAPPTTTTPSGTALSAVPSALAAVVSVHVWDSDRGTDSLAQAPEAYDSSSAGWSTSVYDDGPSIAPFRPGTGLIFDLGSVKDVDSVQFNVGAAGASTEVWTAASSVTAFPAIADSAPPGFTRQAAQSSIGGSQTVIVAFPKAVATEFVMVWFTALPKQPAQLPHFTFSGYRDNLADVKIFTS
jgi:hypothetical protein